MAVVKPACVRAKVVVLDARERVTRRPPTFPPFASLPVNSADKAAKYLLSLAPHFTGNSTSHPVPEFISLTLAGRSGSAGLRGEKA